MVYRWNICDGIGAEKLDKVLDVLANYSGNIASEITVKPVNGKLSVYAEGLVNPRDLENGMVAGLLESDLRKLREL